MAEKIKLVMRSFGAGMASFWRPWYDVYEPPQRKACNVSVYLERVGEYLIQGRRRFEDEKMGAIAYADR